MKYWELKEGVMEFYNKVAPEYDSSSKLRITRVIEKCEEAIICSLLRGKRFQKSIDLGAGTGRYIKFLTCTSKHTIALDFSFNMLKTLREKFRHHPNLDMVCADIEHLPFRNHVFSFALSTLTLDHIPNITSALNEIFRVLNTGGELIISSFNEKILEKYRKEYNIPKDMIDFETENIPKTYIFEKGHTPSEFVKLFEKVGFREVKYVSCCLWPPITLIMSKYVRKILLKHYRPVFDRLFRIFNVFKRNALLYIYLVKV